MFLTNEVVQYVKKTWTPNPTPLLEDYFIELQSMWRTLAGSSMFKKKVKAIDAFVGKTWNHLAFTVRSRYPKTTSQVTSSLLGPMQVCRSKSAPEAQVCQLCVCKLYYGLRHPCKKTVQQKPHPRTCKYKSTGVIRCQTINCNFMQFQFLLPSIFNRLTTLPLLGLVMSSLLNTSFQTPQENCAI